MKQIFRKAALWLMCVAVVAVSLVACKGRFGYEERQRGHWQMSTDGKSKICVSGGDECTIGSKQATIEVDFNGMSY